MKFGARPVDIGDDEVVASFNVYVSPALVNQTHIFQYPLRRKQRPYEVTEVKLFSTGGPGAGDGDVPKDIAVLGPSSRLTMKCTLDTFGSPSFRPTQEAAEDALGQTESQRHHTFSYTLQSQPFVPQSNYAIGYLTSEGIHLTPVSTIQQFTPALGVAESATGAVRVPELFCSQINTSVVPAFTVSDRIQRELRRQRSRVLNEEADTAQAIQFFRDDSVESAAVRSRLRSSTLERVLGSAHANAEPARIENSLFPPEILRSGGISGGDEAHPSMIIHRFANRRSVAEQTSQLLQRCHVITLPMLQSVVVPFTSSEVVKSMATVPDGQLVEALKQCAVLLHGVWVSRHCDQFRGSVAALRELILACFYQSEDGSVARADLNALVVTSTARRSIQEILGTVATLNADERDPSKRRWRLKYVSADRAAREAAQRSFKVLFAAEEAAQHEAWRRRCTQVAAHIPYINAGRAAPQLLLRPRGQPAPTTSAAGGPLAYSSAGAASPVGSTSSPVPSGFAGGGAQALAPPSGSPTASGVELGIRDVDVAPIRHYIRELFAEHGVINKQRVKDLVIRAQEARYPHASKAMLSTALQQCLDKFTDATWVLKTVGEPLADYYRPAILSVVLELRQFEMAALMRRLEEVVQERGLTSPPESTASRARGGGGSALEAVVHRVVAEVAEFKVGGRLWHVKGGNLMHE
ncbi:Sin-like protein conserved region containing protein [Novymonas esmeraldas]|uniref:Sin-like protein conserved region containing protein n=1 Tax=Novymonas esmeraldas TaxID=1808958 RepID=A0AAW0EZP1_9TRYP